MPETETVERPSGSDEARSREAARVENAAPATPPRPFSPLDKVARAALDDQATTARAKVESTTADLSGAQKEHAERATSGVDAYVKAAADFMQKVGESRVPAPNLPPPPRPQLRQFLQPRDGQSPETTTSQLIAALSTMMTMGTSLGRGNAKTALSAFVGALQGWQDGDKELADREFKRWKAETDTAIRGWETQRAQWEDWFKAGKLSLDQRMKGLELAMAASGLQLDAKRTEAEGAKYLLAEIDKQQQHADQLAHWTAQIEEARRHNLNTEEYHKESLKIQREKIVDAARAGREAMEAYTPEVLSTLGQQWALTGKIPGGLGLGRTGQAIRAKVVNAGIEWARANGIDPASLPSVQAEVQSAKKGLDKVRGQNAVAMANVANFEKHLASLVELSKKVDRTGRPVINRYLLKVKGQYEGDADVATYEAQAFEVSMEFAKVMVGSAQGDASTRDEARHTINSALTHEQLVKIAAQLKTNAQNRLKAYQESEAELAKIVDTAGGRTPGTAPPPAAAGGWSIKRLD